MIQVIVAGAGFSAPARVPLLSGLSQRVADIMKRVDPGEESSLGMAVRSVSVFCREFLGCTVTSDAAERMRGLSLEDLCTAIDWAIDRRDVLADKQEPTEVARGLMELIVTALDEAEHGHPIGPYADFLRRLDDDTQGQWAIISLNWDTVVERAASEAGLVISLGPTVFRQSGDNHTRFHDSQNRSLIKLHGSVNWGECSLCRGLFARDSTILDACPKCSVDSRVVDLRRIIVAPTLMKRIHNPSLNLLWDEALYIIRSAQQVCIIGYSLPGADYEVRHLLTRALAGKGRDPEGLRVVLTEQDMDNGTIERYKYLFGLRDESFSFKGTESLLPLCSTW